MLLAQCPSIFAQRSIFAMGDLFNLAAAAEHSRAAFYVLADEIEQIKLQILRKKMETFGNRSTSGPSNTLMKSMVDEGEKLPSPDKVPPPIFRSAHKVPPSSDKVPSPTFRSPLPPLTRDPPMEYKPPDPECLEENEEEEFLQIKEIYQIDEPKNEIGTEEHPQHAPFTDAVHTHPTHGICPEVREQLEREEMEREDETQPEEGSGSEEEECRFTEWRQHQREEWSHFWSGSDYVVQYVYTEEIRRQQQATICDEDHLSVPDTASEWGDADGEPELGTARVVHTAEWKRHDGETETNFWPINWADMKSDASDTAPDMTDVAMNLAIENSIKSAAEYQVRQGYESGVIDGEMSPEEALKAAEESMDARAKTEEPEEPSRGLSLDALASGLVGSDVSHARNPLPRFLEATLHHHQTFELDVDTADMNAPAEMFQFESSFAGYDPPRWVRSQHKQRSRHREECWITKQGHKKGDKIEQGEFLECCNLDSSSVHKFVNTTTWCAYKTEAPGCYYLQSDANTSLQLSIASFYIIDFFSIPATHGTFHVCIHI